MALAAVAFGVLMSAIKGTGGGARLQFGNLSAPWLLVAFLAGSRYRRVGAAAAAGVVATIAALVGFYGEQSPVMAFSASSLRFVENPAQVFAFIGSAHSIVYIGGIATGLGFGALGAAWSARRSRLALGVVAVAFLAEPASWVAARAEIGGGGAFVHHWWIWLGEMALGVALLAGALHPRGEAPDF